MPSHVRLPLLGALACLYASLAPATEGFPTRHWPVAEPASVGVDAAALASFDADIRSGHYPLVDSLLVARCGTVVFDVAYPHDYAATYDQQAHERGPLNARLTGPYNYFDPNWHPYYHGTVAHSMQSVSKSVTSVTIGIAIARGDLKASLDTPVLRYFDRARVRHVDARKERLTLRHVLTMTTGLDWNEDLPYEDPNNASSLMEATDDWVGFTIDRPMVAEPGTTFAYSSGATMLLAHVFKRETGQDLDTYARRYLFRPLGIRDSHWKHAPDGVVDAEGGLYLSTEDLAKIGYLYLHQGRWEGRQVVSRAWVEQSLTPAVDAGHGWRYGYQWWLRPHGAAGDSAFAAMGIGGQILIVYPKSGLIVASTAWHILSETWLEDDITTRLEATLAPHACGVPR